VGDNGRGHGETVWKALGKARRNKAWGKLGNNTKRGKRVGALKKGIYRIQKTRPQRWKKKNCRKLECSLGGKMVPHQRTVVGKKWERTGKKRTETSCKGPMGSPPQILEGREKEKKDVTLGKGKGAIKAGQSLAVLEGLRKEGFLSQKEKKKAPERKSAQWGGGRTEKARRESPAGISPTPKRKLPPHLLNQAKTRGKRKKS